LECFARTLTYVLLSSEDLTIKQQTEELQQKDEDLARERLDVEKLTEQLQEKDAGLARERLVNESLRKDSSRIDQLLATAQREFATQITIFTRKLEEDRSGLAAMLQRRDEQDVSWYACMMASY
jgi:hypothetical protein